jgi:hypothetical protein
MTNCLLLPVTWLAWASWPFGCLSFALKEWNVHLMHPDCWISPDLDRVLSKICSIFTCRATSPLVMASFFDKPIVDCCAPQWFFCHPAKKQCKKLLSHFSKQSMLRLALDLLNTPKILPLHQNYQFDKNLDVFFLLLNCWLGLFSYLSLIFLNKLIWSHQREHFSHQIWVWRDF